MLERYEEDPDPHSADNGLDEYLCEYVDGSMDPAVREVFEEYLAQNPRLAEHVACLCRTRSMLAHQNRCPVRADRLHHRLHLEIARDLMGEPHGTPVWAVPSLGSFARVTSAVAIMMLVGVVFGSIIFAPDAAPYTVAQDSMHVPSEAHGVVSQPLEALPVGQAALGVPGPVTVLPVLTSSRALTPLMGPDEWQVVLTAP